MDSKPSPLTDTDLDAILEHNQRMLDAHVKAGGSPQDLQLRLIHRQRDNDAKKRRAVKPNLNLCERLDDHEKLLAMIRADFRTAATEKERSEAVVGLDQMLIVLQQALSSGTLEDVIHVMSDVCRKAYIGQFHGVGLDPDPARWGDQAKSQIGWKE